MATVSVFERTRALHADAEAAHEALMNTLARQPHNEKERVLLHHLIRAQLDELRACQEKIVQIYEDKEGARSSELSAMSGGDTMWIRFYDSLSQTRQWHQRFPQASIMAAARDKPQHEADEQEPLRVDGVGGTAGKIQFTAEEAFGERLDLHALHARYINLPQFARSTDYLHFLSNFHKLYVVPRPLKLKARPEAYKAWVRDVLAYLLDFHQRIRPLVDVDGMRGIVREEFEEAWKAKSLVGWFDAAVPTTEQQADIEAHAKALAAQRTSSTAASGAAAPAADAEASTADTATAAAGSSAAADSSAASTDSAAPTDSAPVAAAATVTAPPAPSSSAAAPSAAADSSNPLYCQACVKLFTNPSVFKAHLSGKKHKRNEEVRRALDAAGSAGATDDKPSSAAADPAAAKLAEECHSLALLEFEVGAFAEVLSDRVESTLVHLTKKQTRSYAEIALEFEQQLQDIEKAKLAAKGGDAAKEGEEEEEEEEEDPNAPIYNPLNLPLGFDGKPIPYWLYKLHGLNLKFNCEICGDYTYYGPRNFERHFTEWRHAYGMRALGIPNTKHFAHITKMSDAQQLFDKLKKEGVGAGWKPDEEEEFEDADGNVFNKRTYLELQKQGLI